MWKIIYLPTAEIVNTSNIPRPDNWFDTETRARAFMENNTCLYPRTKGHPLLFFVGSGEHVYETCRVVPTHLLEVIEVI